jgi:hypothetical protein
MVDVFIESDSRGSVVDCRQHNHLTIFGKCTVRVGTKNRGFYEKNCLRLKFIRLPADTVLVVVYVTGMDEELWSRLYLPELLIPIGGNCEVDFPHPEDCLNIICVNYASDDDDTDDDDEVFD